MTLTDCTISGNSSSTGGGIINVTIATLTDCTLTGNVATSKGGGIWNGPSAPLTLTDCTISGNAASSDGGIYGANTNTTVIGCTVSLNSAVVAGGGIEIQFSSTLGPVITDTIASGNVAPTASDIQGQYVGTHDLVGGNVGVGHHWATTVARRRRWLCWRPVQRRARVWPYRECPPTSAASAAE